jgi:tetratricopeptide (TPR) repeat protein
MTHFTKPENPFPTTTPQPQTEPLPQTQPQPLPQIQAEPLPTPMCAPPIPPMPIPSAQPVITSPPPSPSPIRHHSNVLPLLIVLIFIIMFVSAGIGFVTYVRPRWILAQAISNTFSQNNYRSTVELNNGDIPIFTRESEFLADPQAFGQNNLTVHYPVEDGKTATLTMAMIENTTDSYVKIKHSHMSRMYSVLVWNRPELKDDKAFQQLTPVLNGDRWLHEELTGEVSEADDEMGVLPILLALAAGTIQNEYDPRYEIGGEMYAKYSLGIQTLVISSLVEDLKEGQVDLNIKDLNRLVAAIEKTESLRQNVIDVIIDPKLKRIHKIEVRIPKELIAELSTDDQTAQITNPLNLLGGNPLEIINWLNNLENEAKIVLTLHDFDTVIPVEAPQNSINIKDIENNGEVIPFMMTFLSDPKALEVGAGSKNQFSAASNEAALLFNQGKYAQGLAKGQETLSFASTDEEKAIAHYWIGLHTFKLGRSDEAERILMTAASLKDRYAGPYVTLGAISAQRGDYIQMRDYSLTCREYDPEYAWCYNNLGIATEALGQKQEAIRLLEQAVSLDPLSQVFNDNLKRMKESY